MAELDYINMESHYRVMRLIEKNPEISQRELARSLDISLGKVNFVLKALMEKGWVKAKNFKNSKNKVAYAYYLTPYGIEEKTGLTKRFLKRKLNEYDALKREIDQLKEETEELTS